MIRKAGRIKRSNSASSPQTEVVLSRQKLTQWLQSPEVGERESSTRVNQLFSGLPYPALIVTHDSVVLFNQAAAPLVGGGQGDRAHFKNLLERVQPADIKSVKDFLHHLLSESIQFDSLKVRIRFEDHPHPCLITGKRVSQEPEPWFLLVIHPPGASVSGIQSAFPHFEPLMYPAKSKEDTTFSTAGGTRQSGRGDTEVLFSGAPVGIQYLDENGLILRANAAQLQLLGYPKSQYVASHITDYFTDLQAAADFFSLLKSQKNIQNHEVKLRRIDGSIRIALIEAQRQSGTGRKKELICFCRDITKLRQQQLEILNATEEVREQICHDLHDGVGFDLMNLKFKLALFKRELQTEQSPSSGKVDGLEELLNQVIVKTRELNQSLQPVLPTEGGFRGAITTLCQRISQVSNAHCTFYLDEPETRMNHQTASNLYRITQEAMFNAVKHGHATQISVYLKIQDGRISLMVKSDGIPFAANNQHSQGMGLKIMNFRANAIGASLQIKRGKPSGTIVNCTLQN